MAEQQRDKIEYDFEDLRRNEDPIPDNVLDQLGLEDEDLTEDERQDDTKAKDDSEELDDRDEEDIELDEDGEYKPAKMTNAMRKRIMKVKRDAKRDIAAAKAEAGEEISKLTKRIDELEKSGKTDELDNEFTGKLEDLESQMEAAMEDGDSKKVTSLTRQMSELTADIRDRKRELERDEPDDLEDEEEDKQKIIPRAVEWLKEQEWWDDEDLGHVRAYVRKADIALQKKGYKPTDDDFYEQLEAAVEKKYPGSMSTKTRMKISISTRSSRRRMKTSSLTFPLRRNVAKRRRSAGHGVRFRKVTEVVFPGRRRSSGKRKHGR
jgi:hypothetical protein